MKLVIGIPTGGHPAKPFVESLGAIVLPSSITTLENKTVTGNFVPAQRELLAEFAIERAADFLLMSDDDMVIPATAVEQLLEPFSNPRVGIVGALCYSRDGLRPMAVSDWDPNDTTGAGIPAFDASTPTLVDGIGFGLAMLRVQAFAPMKRPLFAAHVYVERAISRVRICNEDFLFCNRLRRDGWDVMLHPGVRCGHFDRDSEKTYPLQWERPEDTNSRRMLVRSADGTIAKVPFDASVARAPEKHARADVEYILSD